MPALAFFLVVYLLGIFSFGNGISDLLSRLLIYDALQVICYNLCVLSSFVCYKSVCVTCVWTITSPFILNWIHLFIVRTVKPCMAKSLAHFPIEVVKTWRSWMLVAFC